MQRSVLHICKVFLPVKGGVQKAVAQITSTIDNFAHHVLTTGDDGAISQQKLVGAEVVRSRSYGQVASLPIAPSLVGRIIMRARKYDIVAVHYPFPLADLALLFVPFPPPIVVHWHSDIIAQKRLKWLVAPLTLLLLIRCKAIVVTSSHMLAGSWFLRTFQRKIHYIPYGISASKALNPTAESQGRQFFLIIGRHVSYKGIDVAIKAVENLDARLVIAGHGPLYEQHEEMIRTRGLEDKITLMRHASDDDIDQLINQALALVVPSVQENEAFALVQLEAMRQAKPIINTSLRSSVPWVARSGKEAITVEPRNVEALSLAMQRLLDDPALAKKLGVGGLLRFDTEFNAAMFKSRIEKLYSDIVQ